MREAHATPSGTTQEFWYSRLTRIGLNGDALATLAVLARAARQPGVKYLGGRRYLVNVAPD
ncbi:MAG: hypothetical protein M3545_03650 [Acidobacteriota bacterium]|nr:hypothetical protein [Acidobacteriota bacterium]